MLKVKDKNGLTNGSTLIFATIFGILTGLGGSIHGIFEILKGNIQTGGFLIKDIGAVSLFHNYLLTGIFSLIFGSFIIVWSVFFIYIKHGAIIYLFLSIILFFVGGGIAQILIIIITWFVATRINKPLLWWEKVLQEKARRQLAYYWLLSLIIGLFLFITGVGIWLIEVPPGTSYTITQYICWGFLAVGLLFLVFAIISGFARDIEKKLQGGM